MPIVKHNWIVKDINELAETIREAFIVASSGRPGPVLVDIPKDITVMRCEWDRTHTVSVPASGGIAERLAERGRRETFTAANIEKAVALITGAKRPMLYAGGGVILSGADAELKKNRRAA
jgi:acetolactate synthase-1/2/3 large subunit